MAGDDEAGSGATTTAETDRPQDEDATTPDAPPSDREGSGEAPSGGDDDPSVGTAAGRSEGASDEDSSDDTDDDTEAEAKAAESGDEDTTDDAGDGSGAEAEASGTDRSDGDGDGDGDGEDSDAEAKAGDAGHGGAEAATGSDGAASDSADDADDSTDSAGSATAGPDFDVDVAEARLKEVEEQIEEGRRALADVAKATEPEPEDPPVAEGEGAANAPPG